MLPADPLPPTFVDSARMSNGSIGQSAQQKPLLICL
jgi:hypothetical protein